MAKWIDGERPRPPIDSSQIVSDIEEIAVAWHNRGYSWSEVAAALGEISAAALRFSRQSDPALYAAALAGLRRDVRQTIRDALRPGVS